MENYSAGFSSDMAATAMSAVGSVVGALGNKNESNTSETQSAVGNNIVLNIKDEESRQKATALSRDTENANQKVQAFDLAEIKEQQEMAQVAGQVGAKLVGDVSQMLDFKDGSPQKIALHAVVGALTAKWSGGNVAAGASAGALSEWANTEIADYLSQHPEFNLTQDERNAIQQATAAALGAAAGAIIGGNSETAGQGALTALNAERYNRQLHPDEVERIKKLSNGDKEKEQRLLVAACALVNCSAQLSEDNPNFEQMKALLSKQTSLTNDPLDAFGVGRELQLFDYNGIYGAIDKGAAINEKYSATTILSGALQAAGGGALVKDQSEKTQ